VFLIDRALHRRHQENRPIRVGMVGAGFMGRGIALQILTATAGMRLVAIAARRVDEAGRAYREAGADVVARVEDVAGLEDAIAADRYAVCDDPALLCESPSIDAIVEVTGAVEYSARVAIEAIRRRKHLVLMNAELDGTVGPLLQHYARRAGVVLTNAGGDQPGVTMNLYRFVVGIGVRPVLCGNIKGLQDPYRNPTTQAGFAQRWGQRPTMVTSFADGTKISFEQAIVANATGMRVGRRGMFGPTVPPGTPVTEAAAWYPHEALLQGRGIVDYVVGASPGPGVFVLGVHDHPAQQHYLNLYKLGEGPFYCFQTPYHLCHFEVPATVARAVDFGDATIAPLDGPMVDVIATAKVDLEAGQAIDGIGGYHTYGQCENAGIVYEQRLLPMGLAEGCRLVRPVGRDQVLTYGDVELPPGRTIDRLRAEQNARFMGADAAAGAAGPGPGTRFVR
jgi:predicted homoserine dehydrogenase-like protein